MLGRCVTGQGSNDDVSNFPEVNVNSVYLNLFIVRFQPLFNSRPFPYQFRALTSFHSTWHLVLKIIHKSPNFVLFRFTDLHWMGQLLFGARQVEADRHRSVNRLSRRFASGRSHWSCYHIQSTWFSEEAENTTANGELLFIKILSHGWIT